MTQEIKEVSQDTQNLTFNFQTSNPVRNLVVVVGAAAVVVAFTRVVTALTEKL